eukprot:240901-Prorocentrum_minimum.AAC.5
MLTSSFEALAIIIRMAKHHPKRTCAPAYPVPGDHRIRVCCTRDDCPATACWKSCGDLWQVPEGTSHRKALAGGGYFVRIK